MQPCPGSEVPTCFLFCSVLFYIFYWIRRLKASFLLQPSRSRPLRIPSKLCLSYLATGHWRAQLTSSGARGARRSSRAHSSSSLQMAAPTGWDRRALGHILPVPTMMFLMSCPKAKQSHVRGGPVVTVQPPGQCVPLAFRTPESARPVWPESHPRPGICLPPTLYVSRTCQRA